MEKNMQVDSIQLALNKKAKRREVITKLLPFLGLVFLLVLFSLTSNGQFLTGSNFDNLINQCFQLVIVAVGAAFIYAAGMMDMALGSISGMSMLIMGIFMRDFQINPFVAILIGIVVAVACESITSIVHITLRVPVFVASLCVMNICTGINTMVTEQNDVYIDYVQYQDFNSVPAKIIVLVVVIAIGWYIFNYTRLGKDLKAIGGNSTAAYMSGVKRGKSVFLAFVVLGVCLGISAFFSLVRTGQITAQSGSALMLNILTAIVLGGFPLSGGANSKLYGPIIGALMVTVLVNGLLLMGLDPAWGNLAKGVLFLIVVGLTYERSRYVS